MLIAIGQDNAFPWIERDLGIEFGKWDMPQVNETSFQSSNPKVFFGAMPHLVPRTSLRRSRMAIRPPSQLICFSPASQSSSDPRRASI